MACTPRHGWLGVLLACACGSRSALDTVADASVIVLDAHPPHDVAVEIAPPPPPIDAAPDVPPPPPPLCMASHPGPPASPCDSVFDVGAITPSSSGCFVDLLVHEGDQGLSFFNCSTGNPTAKFWANANFPGGAFPGAIQGDNIDLCSGTTFTGPDGCTWQSAQEISGNLDAKTLIFTYHEHVIAGAGCALPCDALGSVLVQ